VVLEALARKDHERRAVVDELARLQPVSPAPVALEPRLLRRQLRQYVDRWQEVTTAEVPETRGLLETVLRGRIAFQPIAGENGAPTYELTIPLRFDRLLVAACRRCQARVGLASPTGSDASCKPTFAGIAA
jgi:hypothetical protein